MNKVLVEIFLGDITKIDTDAIVNAAHEFLMGGGGVDGAIHKASGPNLLAECFKIPLNKNRRRLEVGEVKITQGYNLPSKYIIHTVAPKFIGGATKKEVNGKIQLVYKNIYPENDEKLADCYKNAIMLADKYKLKSIAFPSLGTGGHAYPIEVACPIAVESTLEAIKKVTALSKVVFVCYGKFDYEVYENLLKTKGII